MKMARLSALRTGRLYPSENNSDTHFCLESELTQGHSNAKGFLHNIKIREQIQLKKKKACVTTL